MLQYSAAAKRTHCRIRAYRSAHNMTMVGTYILTDLHAAGDDISWNIEGDDEDGRPASYCSPLVLRGGPSPMKPLVCLQASLVGSESYAGREHVRNDACMEALDRKAIFQSHSRDFFCCRLHCSFATQIWCWIWCRLWAITLHSNLLRVKDRSCLGLRSQKVHPQG